MTPTDPDPEFSAPRWTRAVATRQDLARHVAEHVYCSDLTGGQLDREATTEAVLDRLHVDSPSWYECALALDACDWEALLEQCAVYHAATAAQEKT